MTTTLHIGSIDKCDFFLFVVVAKIDDFMPHDSKPSY